MNRRELLNRSVYGAGAFMAGSALRGWAGAPASPEAMTAAGRLRGFLDRGVCAFKGIPYGANTAPRRFMAPIRPGAWSGTREATVFGPRAPQPARAPRPPKSGPGHGLGHGPEHGPARMGYRFPPELGPVSEDCLYLNVWTAGLRDGRKRPVMVYIHGGAYSSGSANNILYNGVNLCRRGDVVVVTLNHRLNLFGYLYLAELAPGFEDSGNAGMLDLVLALEWVRDNIEEFGGDPQRVLIFGQSGGGAKCATLMGMKAAHGLFNRVITMSGEQITASRQETATARSRAVLKALGLPESRIEELRTMPMERLIAVSHAAGYYGPVRDGRTLTRDPFDPDAPPLSEHIPMILGNTHDETRLLIGAGDPSTFTLTWETLPAKLAQHAQFLGDLNLSDVIRDYRGFYPSYSASDVFFAVTTASRSWRGQLIEAERRAAQPAGAAPTWVYELDWRTPIDGGKWGAPHTLDIPLAFDNVDAGAGMCGDGPGARKMADAMSETFIAFARTGNPNHGGLPRWRPYNLKERPTMSFDLPPRLVDDPRGK
ncbi:MAG: carboxylesterase/lipase family protein, partial [Terracidiphilus sp.]